jgi:uncharacterized protein (TIGR00661 family)
MLEGAGHEVAKVFVGETPGRNVPGFVRDDLGDLLETYPTPRFALDSKKRGVRPWLTAVQTLRAFPEYWGAMEGIHRLVTRAKPTLIINFYDLMGGLYSSVHRPQAPIVAIGHQFLLLHPDFPIPGGQPLEVVGVRANTLATALGARIHLCLSFTPLPDVPDLRLRAVPPLLRKAVLSAEPTVDDHILSYVVNAGYGDELAKWHREHPSTKLHCFWDRTDVPETLISESGLTFHRLNGEAFLDLLSGCRGYVSTAGFESTCEAAFLGKPVMVVPTEGHLEQRCNALDAARAGLATWREDFDLTEFVASIDSYRSSGGEDFRRWVLSAEAEILPVLETVAEGRDPFRTPR